MTHDLYISLREKGLCPRCRVKVPETTPSVYCSDCVIKRSQWYQRTKPKRLEASKQWTENNRERYNARMRNYNRKNKDKVLAQNRASYGRYKEVRLNKRSLMRLSAINRLGGVCKCCGESESRFLTIDHKNNDGYLRRHIDGVGYKLYKRIIDAKDLRPISVVLQILCWNCNEGKRWNGGVCPHENHKIRVA